MKRHLIFFFLILGCFFAGVCWAGDFYVGVLAGGSGDFDLKKSKADASMGYYVGAHLGYKFYRHFRLEEEVIYQQSKIHSFEIREIKLSHVKGDVGIWSLMTHVLLDLDFPFFMTPYFGGGIGYANANGHWTAHREQGGRKFSFGKSFHAKQKFEKNGFAWQLIAGLKFFACFGFEAGFEYRYFKIEDITNHRFGLALTKFF